MTLVDPSGGQLLLGFLSGLSLFLSSHFLSSSHTSRGIAEFHVTNFRHDYFILVVYFFPRQVKSFFPATRDALKALSKEPLSMPPCVIRLGTAGP